MTALVILIILAVVSLSRKYRRRDLRGKETRNASDMLHACARTHEVMKVNVSYIITLDNIPTKNN